MPRTDERGGPQTRKRISDIATALFLERGFDAVTVAEVARAAGVSSVTVFNHFARKEDLLFDREEDAVELLRSAIRDRGDLTVLESLQQAALHLFEAQHALAAVDSRSVPFFRTVAESPTLIARVRVITAELQRTLATELDRDQSFERDGTLAAALVIAGYSTILVENAQRLIAGETPAEVARDHVDRLDRLFDALRSGLS